MWGGSTSRLTDGRTFFIDQYFVHPQFDVSTYDYDVAVMRMDVISNNCFAFVIIWYYWNYLSQPESLLQGFPNVLPIQLPPNCASACCGVCPPGNKITVTGWGIYNLTTRQTPVNLHKVEKPITPQNECEREHGQFGVAWHRECSVQLSRTEWIRVMVRRFFYHRDLNIQPKLNFRWQWRLVKCPTGSLKNPKNCWHSRFFQI